MSIRKISVTELNEMITGNIAIEIIDVRSTNEYHRGHIPGAKNLKDLALAEWVRNLPAETAVALVCQSGVRSELTCNALRQTSSNILNVDGGTTAWQRAGLPLEIDEKMMPAKPTISETNLRRQTHLIAGLMLIVALSVGLKGKPEWLTLAWLPAFGLMLDALTGFCPMTSLLRKAPWNAF